MPQKIWAGRTLRRYVTKRWSAIGVRGELLWLSNGRGLQYLPKRRIASLKNDNRTKWFSFPKKGREFSRSSSISIQSEKSYIRFKRSVRRYLQNSIGVSICRSMGVRIGYRIQIGGLRKWPLCRDAESICFQNLTEDF